MHSPRFSVHEKQRDTANGSVTDARGEALI
jgi:hypothetical protein